MIKLKSLLTKKVLYEANLRGEWWFQDGNAQFADGDVGDMNHEAHVIDLLKRQLLLSLGIDKDYEYAPDFSDLTGEIYENIKDDLTEEEKELWNEDYQLVIIKYLERNGETNAREKMSYVNGHHDAREYALKNWGWQRVKGNVIQTQTLTTKDLQNIVNGLYDAFGEELDKKEESEITDLNPFGEVSFNIEVMATRSWYVGVPISILEKRNPVALNPYRTRY